MAANFGKFFGRIKKAPKLKSQASQPGDSDDDEGYQDPSESCPTEPPGGTRTFMPTYPPPRPNSPKVGAKNHHQARKDDYQDPWDSKEPDRKTNNAHTDYEDPFDSKFSNQKRMQQQHVRDDGDGEYSEPYEPVKHLKANTPKDTYEDPWDTRKNIELNNQSYRTTSITSKTVNIQNKQQARRDDYSDPWDSKEASSFKSTEEEDDTYSDPYDTDKPTILDASNRRSVIDDDDVEDDDDLYDIPEDEKNTILGLPSRSGKTSNFNSLPSTTVRHTPFMPARQPLGQRHVIQVAPQSATSQSQGDYDSPWEWQAKNVEEEFAKRFSMSDLPSSQPTAPPRKKSNTYVKTPNINPVPKPARNTFKTEEGPKRYDIDPTIPIDSQRWFHGRIRRGDAEALLKSLPDCSYLIRNSESSKLDYSLSLRNKGETMHLKISCEDGRYILGMNSRPYDTIPDMIHHYSMNKLNIRGAEHVKLQYPVLQENMYFTVEHGT